MPEDACRLCEKCGNPAKQFCSSCRSVFYCSRDCQKLDWKTHKTKCQPFHLETHPAYGRYFIATRDIKAGEVILKEAPVVVGPKQRTSPLCLGCHKKLLGGEHLCTRCNYPLCCASCENSKYHKAECEVLRQQASKLCITEFGKPHPAYECIVPLRMLLTKDRDPASWIKINDLQSHEEEVRKLKLHRANQQNGVDFLRDFIGWREFDPAEYHRLCGILYTNSFEVKHNGSKIRGIYPVASIFAHDCTPNLKHVVDEDMNLVFLTTVPVAKGSSLTGSYTNVLWNTLARRHHLNLFKFFPCGCKRCADPTELGTELGTLLCVECGGHVRSTDPLDSEAVWACERCDHRLQAKQVVWGQSALHQELMNLDQSSPHALESFLNRYTKAMHPNHRFFVEAKYTLVRYYGNYEHCRYRDLSKEQLQNKVKWCKELLKLADVIEPGKSVLRGSILLELQAGIVALAKYKLSNDFISEEEAGKSMNEAIEPLKEASEILKHDPEMAAGGLDAMLKRLTTELEL